MDTYLKCLFINVKEDYVVLGILSNRVGLQLLSQTFWAPILIQPLISYVTLSKIINHCS